MTPADKEIYSVLAKVYDTLMEDVDYEAWADFIDEIMQTHHPDPVEIMELACGTGSISFSLAELECYHVFATDKSPEMIEIAREKAQEQNLDVEFDVMDFENIHSTQKFDVVFTVFDSVNYLHTDEQVLKMLEGVYQILKPGGLFIFDFSTPQNSIEAVEYLDNDAGRDGNFRFFRESKYDAAAQFHYNIFDIEELSEDGENVINTYREVHKQRIYTLKEMLSIVRQTSYNLIAKYEDFELDDADKNSTRVTMVLECQKQP